jgi:hypothetical protein
VTEVAILTPVADGRAEDLRALLRGLRVDPAGPSPFAGVGAGTHFARLVVLELDGEAQLLFTTRFDGDEPEYLGGLAARPEAIEVWRRCVRPTGDDVASLRRYLIEDRGDRVPAAYVIRLLESGQTVAQVRAALELRGELADFTRATQGLGAIALAHAFRQLASVRRLAAR